MKGLCGVFCAAFGISGVALGFVVSELGHFGVHSQVCDAESETIRQNYAEIFDRLVLLEDANNAFEKAARKYSQDCNALKEMVEQNGLPVDPELCLLPDGFGDEDIGYKKPVMILSAKP